MPRHAKGPRLYAYRREGRAGTWYIRDGRYFQSTGFCLGDRAEAETKLREYLTEKHQPARQGGRNPDQIAVADVIAIYLTDVAPGHARPTETAQRAEALLAFFGAKNLSEITGNLCREYVRTRTGQAWKSAPKRITTSAAARRELEDLRAAINHHRREGLCDAVIDVVLPVRNASRDRWLTRDEVARLLWAAWRNPKRKHIARFILVALYTGSRASVVCGASMRKVAGRAWIDMERGILYRRPVGEKETAKRKPPVPMPLHLMAHLRRWQRRHPDWQYAVEYGGKPVRRVSKGFRATVRDAGLDAGVTPHVLRHTCATWIMQGGRTTDWEAGGYLGMTPEMIRRTYGHHHPEHLHNARATLDRMPQIRHRLNGTKTEHKG